MFVDVENNSPDGEDREKKGRGRGNATPHCSALYAHTHTHSDNRLHCLQLFLLSGKKKAVVKSKKEEREEKKERKECKEKENEKKITFLTTDAGDLCRIGCGVFPRVFLGKQTNLQVEKHFPSHPGPARRVEGATIHQKVLT